MEKGTAGSKVKGRFLRRLNRFLAEVEIGGSIERCHVKNTGRLRELLVPGANVLCEIHGDPARKTRFSMTMVWSGKTLVSIDSQAPNRAAFAFVEGGGLGFSPDILRREVNWGDSRFDLYFEAGDRRGFVEVKGVTLLRQGTARFPDAPTERGTKHLRGLRQAAEAGYEAYVLFVIQREDAFAFAPNETSDPAFCAALREASEHGVHIMAVRCCVSEKGIKIAAPVPARLDL